MRTAVTCFLTLSLLALVAFFAMRPAPVTSSAAVPAARDRVAPIAIVAVPSETQGRSAAPAVGAGGDSLAAASEHGAVATEGASTVVAAEPEAGDSLGSMVWLEVEVVDGFGRPLEGATGSLRCSLEPEVGLWRLDVDALIADRGDPPAPYVGFGPPGTGRQAVRIDAGGRVMRGRAGLVGLERVEGRPGLLRAALFGSPPLEVQLGVVGPGQLETSRSVVLHDGANYFEFGTQALPRLRGALVRSGGEPAQSGVLTVRSRPGLPDDDRWREDSLALALDEQGRFDVAAPLAGDLGLHAWEANVGRSRPIELSVSAGGSYDLGRLTLEGSGDLRARLQLADGTPLGRRIVEIESLADPPSLPTTWRPTNREGLLECRNLEVGDYSLAVKGILGPVEVGSLQAVPAASHTAFVVEAALLTIELERTVADAAIELLTWHLADEVGTEVVFQVAGTETTLLVPAGRPFRATVRAGDQVRFEAFIPAHGSGAARVTLLRVAP